MSHDPSSRESIFGQAIAIESADDRAAFLDRACRDKPDLRCEVEKLVEDHFRAGAFLEKPAVAPAITAAMPAITEKPGTQIGPYRLLQQIGEGGFGVVFMAAQKEPIRRKVALKVIKPGMDSREVIARFEAERQALAMMDHPNIAHVLDAGTTETGRPFFVMELVRGVSITEFCDTNALSTRERLGIFATVCRAVQHAHQKGVIHRDLKPSNVMVTLSDGQPLPKVIDFGVAKAMNRELTENTLFTAYGQMVGTPQYMSPEQAEMSASDVDTRSDIYSMGVLLYEMLTGTTPLDARRLRAGGYAEMQRIIREEEPPKPSVRLSTLGEQLTVIARNRGAGPTALQQAIRGELDWIVMKTLAKERGRRYATANELALDIKRFLHGDAVEACPPTLWYRLRKAASRHRNSVAVAATVAVALVVSLSASTISLMSVRDSRDSERAARMREIEARSIAEGKAEQLARQQDTLARERDDARRKHYGALMRTAAHVWSQASGDGLVTDALREFKPATPNDPDLRDWEWYLMASGRPPALITLDNSFALCLDWSPVGDRLATAHLDGTLRVWDWKDLSSSVVIGAHRSPVTRVSWCPIGERLLSVGLDGQACVWNTSTWTQELAVGTATKGVGWRPDGSGVAIADSGYVRVWDVTSKSQVLSFPADAEWISWSPDGKWIAATNDPRELVVWNVANDSLETRIQLDEDTEIPERTLGYRAKDERKTIFHWSDEVLSIALENRFTHFELNSWSQRQSVTRNLPNERLGPGTWSPDGRFYACKPDENVFIYDTQTSTEQSRFKGDGMGWDETSGRLAIYASGTLSIHNLDHEEPESVYTFVSGGGPAAWNATGDKIAVASDRVQVLCLEQSKLRPRSGRSFSISPDDRYIAVAGGTETVAVWDTVEDAYATPFESDCEIGFVEFNPDQTRWLAGAAADGSKIVIWDVATRQHEINLRPSEGEAVRSFSWSRFGHLAGHSAQSSRVLVWKVPNESPAIVDSHAERLVRSTDEFASISPQGDRIALLPAPWLDVLDVSAGSLLSRLPGHDAWSRSGTFITLARWSDDGAKLVTASLDGTLKVWDLNRTENVVTFERHLAGVTSLQWSPSERRIASGDASGQIIVWDVETQRAVMSIDAGESAVDQLAWTEDGMLLVASLADEPNLIFLDASPAYLRVRAPDSLPRLDRQLTWKPQSDDYLVRAEIRTKTSEWHGVLKDLEAALESTPREDESTALQRGTRLRRIELMLSIAHGELGDLAASSERRMRADRMLATVPVSLARGSGGSMDLGIALRAYQEVVSLCDGTVEDVVQRSLSRLSQRYAKCAFLENFAGIVALHSGNNKNAVDYLTRSLQSLQEVRFAKRIDDARMKLFKMQYWWPHREAARDPEQVWKIFLDIVGLDEHALPRTPGAIADADLYLQWHEQPQPARTLLYLSIAHSRLGDFENARAAYDEAVEWLHLDGTTDNTTLQIRADALIALLTRR